MVTEISRLRKHALEYHRAPTRYAADHKRAAVGFVMDHVPNSMRADFFISRFATPEGERLVILPADRDSREFFFPPLFEEEGARVDAAHSASSPLGTSANSLFSALRRMVRARDSAYEEEWFLPHACQRLTVGDFNARARRPR